MSFFGIGSVLNVQDKYLADIAKNASGNAVSTPALTSLQSYLNNLYTAYSNSNSNAASVLSAQSDMNTIVTNESDRLNAKKQQIDIQMTSKDRMAQLNDNYKKRQSNINSIFMILVLGFALFILLVKIKHWFPIIPSGIFDALIAILIGVISIIVIRKIYAFNSRDELNFDELKLAPMPADNKLEERRTNKNSGNLLNLIADNCVGEQCCVNGTEWNSGIGKCVPTTCSTGQIYNINDKSCINTADCKDTQKVCGNACIPSTDTCTNGFGCMNFDTPAFTPTEFSNYSLYK